MTPTEFINNVKLNQVDSLYLIYGEENYLQQECFSSLLNLLIPDEQVRMLDFSEHSLSDESVGKILLIANQLPMMAKVRLLMLEDFEKVTDSELDKLRNYFQNPNKSSVLVFKAGVLDKRRSISTTLLRECTVVECKHLSDQEAIAWVEQYVQQQGIQLMPMAIGRLISMVGTDLYSLSGEVNKLITYVGQEKTITPQDVEAVCVYSKTHSNFDLSDAVLAGDAKGALKLLSRLLNQGEEPIALVGVLAWLYRQMMTASILMNTGVSREEIAREIRMPAGRLGNFLSIVRRKSEEEICYGIKRLAEVDLALKSSQSLPRLQLEVLLCDLFSNEIRS